MASSSWPKASSCSGVRLAAGMGIARSLSRSGSKVERDIADRHGHADADLLVTRARDLAAEDVPHGTSRLAAAARVADAHAASVLGGEPGVLGLLEQRQAAVGYLAPAGGEADVALGTLEAEAQRGRRERLDRGLGQAVLRPEGSDRVDQRRWPTDERRRAAVVGDHRAQVLAAKAPGEREAASAREAAGDAESLVALREPIELGLVERELHRARVVKEADLAREALVAEGAQHRHHGRDAAAATDQQHALGSRVGQHEVALRLGQPNDHPRPRVVAQVARHLALWVGGDCQLERAARGVLRASGGVRSRLADTVDLDADADELPRTLPAPVLVRAQRERDALSRLVADGRYLGAHVTLHEQRAD